MSAMIYSLTALRFKEVFSINRHFSHQCVWLNTVKCEFLVSANDLFIFYCIILWVLFDIVNYFWFNYCLYGQVAKKKHLKSNQSGLENLNHLGRANLTVSLFAKRGEMMSLQMINSFLWKISSVLRKNVEIGSVRWYKMILCNHCVKFRLCSFTGRNLVIEKSTPLAQIDLPLQRMDCNLSGTDT